MSAKAFDLFLPFLKGHGLPQPVTEFRFAPPRRWRFDYCWPDRMIALEQEGGVWTGGRHTRGVGFEKDCEKYAEANLRGWKVFRASTRQMTDGTVIAWLKRADL